MMIDTQYTSPNTNGRTANFQLGMTGGGPRATSLEQVSLREQSEVPKGFSPASILDAYQYPNYHPVSGNSAFDASRQTPSGQIPTPNAMSQSTWSARNPSMFTRLALR